MTPRAPAWKGRYLPAATLRSMRAWLFLSIPILVAGCMLTGCGQALPNWAGRKAIDPPLAKLPRLEHPREVDGKVEIRVIRGHRPHLEDHITELKPGPRTLLVVTGEDRGDGESEPGGSGPIALWLRGRGSQQAVLPQFTSGRVNPGTRQDWQVDLQAGEYLLSISYGLEADEAGKQAIIVVR